MSGRPWPPPPVENATAQLRKKSSKGAVLRTEYRDGYIIEAGPDSFLTEKPDASRLCHDLGLGDELIPSNDFQRKTYILVRDRLVLIPDGLQFMVPTRLLPMVTTPLFSRGQSCAWPGNGFAVPAAIMMDVSDKTNRW